MHRTYSRREIALLWVFIWLLRAAFVAMVVESWYFHQPMDWIGVLAMAVVMLVGFELCFVRAVRDVSATQPLPQP